MASTIIGRSETRGTEGAPGSASPGEVLDAPAAHEPRSGGTLKRSAAALFLLVAVAYGVGSQLAFSWFGADGVSSSFFPAAGVTLAALVLVERRRWPVVLAAAGTAELALDLWHDIDLAPTLGYVLANLTQPLVGALLLLAVAEKVDLGRTRDLAAFVACAVVVAPAVGGMLGATSFVLVDGGEGWARFAAEWWVGDGLGVLVVGGAILSLHTRPGHALTTPRILEGLALAALAALCTAAVFRLEWVPLVYLPIAILVVLAFRVGTRGVALTGAALAFIAAEATAEGHTFWDTLGVEPTTGLVYLQLGLGVVITSMLALAAEIAERERTARALASAEAARQATLERAELFESERQARERAELLERHAARLAAATSVREVAETTLTGLEGIDIDAAWVQLVRDGQLEIVAETGVPPENLALYRRYPLEHRTPPAEAVRTGGIVEAGTGAELDERYPDIVPGRHRLVYESLVSLPLRAARGDVVGALTFTSSQPRWLDTSRRQLVTALAEQCGLALERAQLREAADAAAEKAAFLVRLAASLESATSVDERTGRLLDALSEKLTPYAAVHLVEEDGSLTLARESGAAGTGGDGADLARSAIRTGVPARSATLAALPLRARGRTLGALVLATPQTEEAAFDEAQAREIAARAAVALDNALLYEREREVSHSLQTGLLGGRLASAAGTELATAYRPGTATLEVGGDWYDAFLLPDGTLGVVVGDVVGHGLEAAVAMGQLRGAVRALAPTGSPAQVLEHLDRFVESLPEAAMATLAYVQLDPSSGHLRFACAGHPPPLVVSADGTPYFLWEGRSAPLGSVLGAERSEAEAALEPDETLVLFTDGLVERRTESIADGLDDLVEAAQRCDAETSSALVDALLGALLGDEAREDDVCVLALRRTPEAARFTHSFPASPPEIARLRRELEGWLQRFEVSDDARRGAVLAVSEAAANAAEHAYGFDAAGTVTVEARLDGGRIHAEVRDGGSWRAPREGSDRGRGLRIIEALADDVAIESNDPGTTVRMALPTRVTVTA